jgi:putative effector of murein hydrolase LrgA (UPF0299 family)
MLHAFGVLLSCQLAGEVVTRAFALPLPGPVLGLVFLVIGLRIAQAGDVVDPARVDGTGIGKLAAGLLSMLGILFVPAGVGVTQNLPLFLEHGAALLAALVVSTVLTLLVTVWVFVAVSRRLAGGTGAPEDGA